MVINGGQARFSDDWRQRHYQQGSAHKPSRLPHHVEPLSFWTSISGPKLGLIRPPILNKPAPCQPVAAVMPTGWSLN
jgi:hypothetical protein